MFENILDKVKKLFAPKPQSIVDQALKPTGAKPQAGQIQKPIASKPQSQLDHILKPMASKPLADLDLMAALEDKAKGTDLEWKTSVVDFLKLLGINSSLKNRDALAAELGVDPALESGSAAKNEALRVAVFKKLAENGGNIPNSLLD